MIGYWFKILVLIQAKYWKQDEATGKLENKAYPWIYANNSFTIPEEGEEGFIEEKSEESLGVLTVIKDDTVDDNASDTSEDTLLKM